MVPTSRGAGVSRSGPGSNEHGRFSVRTLPAMPRAKPGDAARKVIMARADKRAAGLRPTIEALQASGVTSLRGMAAALNEAGIPTPRGKRQWHPVQVRRLLARL
jgi:hypothetical protein